MSVKLGTIYNPTTKHIPIVNEANLVHNLQERHKKKRIRSEEQKNREKVRRRNEMMHRHRPHPQIPHLNQLLCNVNIHLEHIQKLLPPLYKLTLVARYVGSEHSNVDVVSTSDIIPLVNKVLDYHMFRKPDWMVDLDEYDKYAVHFNAGPGNRSREDFMNLRDALAAIQKFRDCRMYGFVTLVGCLEQYGYNRHYFCKVLYDSRGGRHGPDDLYKIVEYCK
jgi:hypothetical protein